MFDKGNWQAFTAVVKYIDLFDKANCPAFSTQPIHERYDVPRPMPTGGAEQSSLPWNVIIYNFPGCSAAETPYKVH